MWASIKAFFLSLIDAEVPVAEGLIVTEVNDLPQELAASKPLVAAGQLLSAAAANAATQGISIGVHAVAVAVANGVATAAAKTPAPAPAAGA